MFDLYNAKELELKGETLNPLISASSFVKKELQNSAVPNWLIVFQTVTLYTHFVTIHKVNFNPLRLVIYNLSNSLLQTSTDYK